MTTATTLNGFNGALIGGAGGSASGKASNFTFVHFARMRAALPDMPQTASVARIAAGVALRMSLAAVPFAGLGWLFFTR